MIFIAAAVLAACGQSYEEKKRLTREERMRLAREDSAALKVAVTPTLDCLPVFVAAECGLFGNLGADVRLKYYVSGMDCDEAMVAKKVEVAVIDLVRSRRMERRGLPLEYVAATGAYWQLITNRNARLKELKQLNDKMLAMTRYSAADMLGDMAVDSVGLEPYMVFRIQVNDDNLRLKMLENNEMDAMILTEPQATAARRQKHPVLLDSRKLGLNLGVVAMRGGLKADTARQRQAAVLLKAYDMACDSIKKNGIRAYRDLIMRRCGIDDKTADALPADIRFGHAAAPRKADIDRAAAWLDRKMEMDITTSDEDGGK